MTPRRPQHRERGFTLVEALVALALIFTALLLSMSLLWQQPRTQLRLRAQQEALGAIEGVLEEIRAGRPVSGGFLPTTPYDRAADVRASTPRAADGLRLRLQVEPDPSVPNLQHVTVTAFYRVLGKPERRTVRTMVWRR